MNVTLFCLRFEFIKLGIRTCAGHVIRMGWSDPAKKALCT